MFYCGHAPCFTWLWESKTMDKNLHTILWMTLAVGICLAGCGGGSSSSGSGYSGPAKTLTWAPPTAYTDNTSLNPATDLDVIEVYVKQDGNFTGSDSAMAAIQAVDPNTGLVNTSFNLSNLSPFLPANVTLYVSVRAVANNGLKSDFSQTATFSF